MPSLRLALAQLNARLGDLSGNAELIVAAVREAAEAGADLVACPEMALTGYPVEDLALRRSFRQASVAALEALARQLSEEGLGSLPVLVGFLDEHEDGARNSVAVLVAGTVAGRCAKHHLPNYGVFDEARYFVPGQALLVVRVRNVDVAVAICEDLWQEGGPVAATRDAGAGLLVVINGSPFERTKAAGRLALVRRRAGQAGCALAYVNLVGGQDELVFDGGSLVVDAAGTVLARAARFAPDVLVTDLELPGAQTNPGGAHAGIAVEHCVVAGADAPVRPPLTARSAEPENTETTNTEAGGDEDGDVYAALVTGVRDYALKNGFTSVVLGLSGGIDSALCAAIACDALGADRVHAVSMPSRHSSGHSRSDAAELARRTGLHYTEVPIEPLVAAYLGTLELTGLAVENLQARVRGMILMALSNQHGHLVLATGNKSEVAVGYSTIYGDAVGGYAPLKDVFKTAVWRLSRWRNAAAVARDEVEPIPENSIAKPPSAELRPGQLDTDSLPDYVLLDAILERYVERDAGSAALMEEGFDPALVERVLRMVDLAEYKRRQYPPGPKVSARNFGRDRRLPITNAWREALVG